MKTTNVRFFIGKTNEISLGAKVECDGQTYYADAATSKDVEELCYGMNDEHALDALMRNYVVYGGDYDDTTITEYHGTTCPYYDSFDGTMSEYEG